MLGRHKSKKPILTIHTLRLFLAIGIGVFLSIQIHLFLYGITDVLVLWPILNEPPQTIPKLNATGLQHAIRNLHQRQFPIFLFGHTTGHSGSGTFQESMAQQGCPWQITVDKFEYTADGEKDWAFDKEGFDDKCEFTKNELVPHLVKAVTSKAEKHRRYIGGKDNDDKKRRGDSEEHEDGDEDDDGESEEGANRASSDEKQSDRIDLNSTAFIDLGHFHNTGRTLECLAKLLGERSVFVHIRRNRYSIARSFTPKHEERLDKSDWKRVRRENKMIARQARLKNYSNESERMSPVHVQRRQGLSPDDQDPITDELHRRLESATKGIEHQSQGGKSQDKERMLLEKAEQNSIKRSETDERKRQTNADALENIIFQEGNKAKKKKKDRRAKILKDSKNMTKLDLPQTPCLAQNMLNGKNISHPSVAICPRSTEGRGPVDLSIANDDVWDSLTQWQQFLWYADEMEHRWHTLQRIFYTNHIITPQLRRHVPGGSGKPTFIEVTWDSKDELHGGINWVREQLGCTPAIFLTNEHPHVKHEHGTLNCSQYIWEDLDYRKKMKFSKEANNILFPYHLPQHVDSPECNETSAELEMKIREYSKYHGLVYDPAQWQLADNIAQH